ncbi:MAG TPA: transcription elongation factor GreA [Nitrospiria bacterium]|nr:transcription elongation factor GreA [Nitrospiria bacterium]
MKHPITKEGFEKLKEELARLKKKERPAVIKAISEARAHGDLSENAEYHAAKEKQSFIEGKIQELNARVAHAEVIDPKTLKYEKVVFGATVVLVDEKGENEKTYQLVGETESDLKNGKISVTSPVGRALIGHEVGDEVEIKTPARTITYEIMDIKYI